MKNKCTRCGRTHNDTTSDPKKTLCSCGGYIVRTKQ